MAKWGCKLETNIPLQQIYVKSKGGLIIEGGIMSSEYDKIQTQGEWDHQQQEETKYGYDI